MRPLFFCLALLTTFPLFSQNAVLRGTIVDERQESVPAATVYLLKTQDSALVKTAVSEADGSFVLPGLAEGQYLLRVMSVGLETHVSAPFALGADQDLALTPIALLEQSEALKGVEVVYRQSVIEVQPDKMVFNVEASLSATGSTALEVLQKAPGVVVDRDDNIILQGKNGVQVYIDGKPTPLDPKDLAAYLRTLPSDLVQAIEIITQPSAKYDASGGAGIINIRLKKDKRQGTNGTVSAGYAQGRYYPKFNGSVTLNHRNAKFNVFGTYSNRFARDWSFMDFYRVQLDSFYDQKTIVRSDVFSHNVKAGIDLFLGEKSTLGFLFNGNLSDRPSDNTATTQIGNLNGPVEKVLYAPNTSERDRLNLSGNINYRFADTLGHELTADVDYGRFRVFNNQFQPNSYLDSTETQLLLQRDYRMETQTDIDLYTFKADYSQKLWGGQLGAGFKVAYVRTDNRFDFYDVFVGGETLNLDRTNLFRYTENVNAGYLQYQYSFKKWQIQAGIRVEQTNSQGLLNSAVPQFDGEVTRHYLDFFPSGGITYNLSERNVFGLNYSRRIDRPRYQDLNPFESKLDELTYDKGNAFLRPQYTDNVQLTHTFMYAFTTTLGYSFTADFFTEVTDTVEGNRSYLTTRNLASQRTWSINMSLPFPITKWWNTYTNLGAVRTINRADFGDGSIIDLAVNSASVYSQHTFSLPGKISLEVSGFYNSPSIWGGTFRNRRFWGIDCGAQFKFWSDRASLRLTFSDVFHSMQWQGISDFSGLYMDARGGWESQQFRVNFSYKFGNTQVKGGRQRKLGAEEENNRIK